MKIKKLVKEIPSIQVKGSKDVEINGVCLNSKAVRPGNLFIARKGYSEKGSDYIEEAIAAGAVAIATDMYDPSLKGIVQLIHPNVLEIEALLAAQFYQFPSEELFTVAITGTNGKTTTAYMIKHLLDALELPCGLIGTVEYLIGSFRYQACLTTPDACSNHKMLREMVTQDCKACVMEVSSHALEQGRVKYIDFDVAIFTNLTQDHLDYHKTMEQYAEAKEKLFTSLQGTKKKCHPFPKVAAVNVDNIWHHEMIKNSPAEVITYGIEQAADVMAFDIKQKTEGSTFKLNFRGSIVECHTPFIGLYNIYNYMAAVIVGLVRKIPLADIVSRLDRAPMVPGRLENIPNALGIKVFVDFAHTADALANVLKCLQAVKTKRIVTVFGCGGNRDRTKRAKMAEAAEAFSDITFVTSDNPRNEAPEDICQDIIKGFSPSARYVVEIDRKTAIEKALDFAEAEDIILIAGKGHEPYQIFSHHTITFDDRRIAEELCEKKKRLI